MRDAAADMRDAAIRAYHAAHAHRRRLVRRARRHWRALTPAQRQTARLTTSSAGVGLVVAITVVTATGPWDSGQRTAERAWATRQGDGSGVLHTGDAGDGTRAGGPAPRAPLVLPELGPGSERTAPLRGKADGVPPPTGTALADALEPLLKKDALGPRRGASVVDGTTGRKLFSSEDDRAVTPASTVKLATGAAALSALGPGHRIETTVWAGPKPDEVVLTGGGDPVLSSADLRKLAGDTARELRERGVRRISLGYDTSRYSGPETHPIGPNENLAPVTPLMVDQGRLDDPPESGGPGDGGPGAGGAGESAPHGPGPRGSDPAGDAATAFAKELTERGLDVRGEPRSRSAAKGATKLATHRSVPLADLVERMLTHSDNDIAEALARQTALADGEPASFDGAADAVRARLARLDLPLDGARFPDGSGLDRDARVSAALLTSILVRASGPDHPELRPLLTGLPVAGFSGTLDDRYASERGRAGSGLVRAKTGTLSGVSTLAGTVVDADGRLLAFAFMAEETKDRNDAQSALDRLASALANCGCRDGE
ncbi:D-alanyl-D-alanine carboxypeptidase/D-alanyl-D-alanine-endopeptidase [Streptomyces sp. AJS327]|uniref:D-alanyl-D-alanine carboxypeptidase/D-alanyl-D-alanine endopeptidase n=1 Tax=Streptomyces sp. AJS327 TaxID=2545265 RepID=UPI0015DD548F|nr:D-alanyl-D-alanine carboxypeptidase/D-alanyl-D-alanine-endopeptidase [Streptomyces sp. AJS327]MBA0053061.1 D-alanyl-D-alanine carboxypeptidase/D-alanyl-D-alanine-endopeptidase [Streptomyces sp. AJS327]